MVSPVLPAVANLPTRGDDRPVREGSAGRARKTSWCATAGVVAIVATVIAAASGALSSPAAAAGAKCVANGPTFVIHPAHYGPTVRGTTYYVNILSMGGAGTLSCRWVQAALTKIFAANRTLPHRYTPLKAAPAGFSCKGLSLPPPDVAVSGQCAKGDGRGPGQLFSWNPVDPKLAR